MPSGLIAGRGGPAPLLMPSLLFYSSFLKVPQLLSTDTALLAYADGVERDIAMYVCDYLYAVEMLVYRHGFNIGMCRKSKPWSVHLYSA